MEPAGEPLERAAQVGDLLGQLVNFEMHLLDLPLQGRELSGGVLGGRRRAHGADPDGAGRG
ncbi:MAG TPA: hypothetical protein VK066_15165 [Chloroflexota bacterium]|nr:hypothetical protein [Chloroflexota bacterium]